MFLLEGVSKQQVRRIGEYETTAEAISAAQKVVDAFLQHEFKPGMDAKALFSAYQSQGEYPFIFRDDDRTFNVPGFNHAQYAMARAGDICNGKK